MREEQKKTRKIKINTYFPPFLHGFNVKKIKTTAEDINFEIVTPPALKLLQKVSQEGETTSETIIRIVENYLLLINLSKVYHLLLYDALYHKTHTRLERMKEIYIPRLSGINSDFIRELDTLIGDELPQGKDRAVFRKQLEQQTPDFPTVSNEVILPALNNINYRDVLNRIVEEGIFPVKFLDALSPKTERGSLAIIIYKSTMTLVEKELRKLIKNEQLKAPPKTLEEFYERIESIVS